MRLEAGGGWRGRCCRRRGSSGDFGAGGEEWGEEEEDGEGEKNLCHDPAQKTNKTQLKALFLLLPTLSLPANTVPQRLAIIVPSWSSSWEAPMLESAARCLFVCAGKTNRSVVLSLALAALARLKAGGGGEGGAVAAREVLENVWGEEGEGGEGEGGG